MDFLRSILKYFTDNAAINKRGFFSTFFKTTEEDYTETETVEIDIERAGNKVAPVVKNAKTGAVMISAEEFSTKEYKPPVVPLAYPVDLYELMKRQPGEKDTAAVGSWLGRLFNKLKKEFVRMHKMIKETVELQASQILQTGKLVLKDEENTETYELAYPVKPSHFPTVVNSWGESGADPLADIEALCNAIIDDGKVDPANVIFGQNAWNNALKNDKFKEAVKRDGLGLGALNPALKNRGGRYMGYIDVGTYRLDMWVYNDSYETLADATKHRFMDKDKVIVTAAVEDLDFRCVFGGVPSLGMKEPFTSIMPSVIKYDGWLKINNRVYEDEKSDTYIAEAKSRPLCIPVSIDMFGCITTKAS